MHEHMLWNTWVMAAVKLNLNATYYAQHAAMKSVDQKTQSGIVVSYLFSWGQCLN